MELITNDHLEDEGIQITKKDEQLFLPNYQLKVRNVTKEHSDALYEMIKTNDKEIKVVYELTLFKDDMAVALDETLIIKLPAIAEVEHPSLLIQQADGNYKAIEGKEEDSCYVYESDTLGIVAILDDKNRIM